MRIPFDITKRPQIESGEFKVETREGRPVKIISFEMTDTNDCPIAAQFRLCSGTPVVYLFDKEGHYKGEGCSNYDLFIVTTEPEMSEFENEMLRYLQDAANKKDDSEIVESTKEHSSKLLALAKQQLLQSGELLTQEHHEKLMETLREECKKDLPRWRNVEADKRYVGCVARYMDVNGDWNYCMSSGKLSNDCQYISIAALEKLPKDENHE